MSVSSDLEAWLKDVTLDREGELNASIARALAAKLDEAQGSESGAVAMAVAGISKELRAVIGDLSEATSDSGAYVVNLFSAVGDPKNSRKAKPGSGGDEDRARAGHAADALAAARARRGVGGQSG